jgi:hypothetical protein
MGWGDERCCPGKQWVDLLEPANKVKGLKAILVRKRGGNGRCDGRAKASGRCDCAVTGSNE